MINTDELARMAKEFNQALEAVHDCANSFGGLLKVQVLEMKASVLMNAYSRALAQATEVADENFARAQKLAEQVQDNVKHIERMAEQLEGKVVHLPEWHDPFGSNEPRYWCDQVHKALEDAGVRYE